MWIVENQFNVDEEDEIWYDSRGMELYNIKGVVSSGKVLC